MARAIWLLVSVAALGLWLAGVFANFTEPLPSCIQAECDPFALSVEDVNLMSSLGLPSRLLVVFWQGGGIVTGVFFFVTAVLIFWRRSEDPFSLIVSFFLFWCAVVFTEFDDAASRAFPILNLPFNVIFSIGWSSLVLVFFYFPDGKLVPNTGWMSWIILVFMSIFIVFGSGPARGVNLDIAGPILFLILGTGLAAQIYRYRRVSGPAERQQTKWVIYGLAGAGLVMTLWIWMSIRYPPNPATPERLFVLLWVRPLIIVLIALLPLSILFSILRYRLWDIDILIRRTLTYGLLTGILVAMYFGGVILLQGLFSAISGETRSPFVTVASTLAIAALFNPLRERVQDFIDRRFYRAKFDAEQTLNHFAESVRDEVDLNELSVALLGAVDETMRPEQISLWMTKV